MIIYLNCDDNDTLRSWTKKIYLFKAAERLGLDVFRDIKEIGTEKPDFVLNIQPCNSGIRDGKKWTALWHIDVQLEGAQFPANYAGLSTIFHASSSAIKENLPYGPHHLLLQAADPVAHVRPDSVPIYDMVFSGSMGNIDGKWHEDRKRIFKFLQLKFNVHDAGKNFWPYEYAKEVSKGKVVWVQGGISKEDKGMAAQRFFESLAIGPMLCAWNPDIPLTGLVDGEDFLSYKSDEECVEKMQLLLDDEELRRTITRNGRRKALLYHTYEHRAMSIINVAREFI